MKKLAKWIAVGVLALVPALVDIDVKIEVNITPQIGEGVCDVSREPGTLMKEPEIPGGHLGSGAGTDEFFDDKAE